MKRLFVILSFVYTVTCYGQQEKVFAVKANEQKIQLYPDIDTLMNGTETGFNIMGIDIKKIYPVFSCGSAEMSDKSVWVHINTGLPAAKKCVLQLFSKEQTVKLVYEKSFVIIPPSAYISPLNGIPGIHIYWNNKLLKDIDTFTKSELLIIGKAHLHAEDGNSGFHFVSSFKLKIESPSLNKTFAANAPALKGELLQTLNNLNEDYKITLTEITFSDDKQKRGPFVIWVKN